MDTPTELANYLELAKLHEGNDELQEAEGILRRALSVSGNDLKVRERLEAVQVRRAKHQVASAEKQFAAKRDEESQQLVLQMREQLNRLELGIYQSRSERYPDERRYRYELAVRLKRAKNFEEADAIRQEYSENGVGFQGSPQGTTWRPVVATTA